MMNSKIGNIVMSIACAASVVGAGNSFSTGIDQSCWGQAASAEVGVKNTMLNSLARGFLDERACC
jgi:hypothetical protein